MPSHPPTVKVPTLSEPPRRQTYHVATSIRRGSYGVSTAIGAAACPIVYPSSRHDNPHADHVDNDGDYNNNNNNNNNSYESTADGTITECGAPHGMSWEARDECEVRNAAPFARYVGNSLPGTDVIGAPASDIASSRPTLLDYYFGQPTLVAETDSAMQLLKDDEEEHAEHQQQQSQRSNGVSTMAHANGTNTEPHAYKEDDNDDSDEVSVDEMVRVRMRDNAALVEKLVQEMRNSCRLHNESNEETENDEDDVVCHGRSGLAETKVEQACSANENERYNEEKEDEDGGNCLTLSTPRKNSHPRVASNASTTDTTAQAKSNANRLYLSSEHAPTDVHEVIVTSKDVLWHTQHSPSNNRNHTEDSTRSSDMIVRHNQSNNNNNGNANTNSNNLNNSNNNNNNSCSRCSTDFLASSPCSDRSAVTGRPMITLSSARTQTSLMVSHRVTCTANMSPSASATRSTQLRRATYRSLSPSPTHVESDGVDERGDAESNEKSVVRMYGSYHEEIEDAPRRQACTDAEKRGGTHDDEAVCSRAGRGTSDDANGSQAQDASSRHAPGEGAMTDSHGKGDAIPTTVDGSSDLRVNNTRHSYTSSEGEAEGWRRQQQRLPVMSELEIHPYTSTSAGSHGTDPCSSLTAEAVAGGTATRATTLSPSPSPSPCNGSLAIASASARRVRGVCPVLCASACVPPQSQPQQLGCIAPRVLTLAPKPALRYSCARTDMTPHTTANTTATNTTRRSAGVSVDRVSGVHVHAETGLGVDGQGEPSLLSRHDAPLHNLLDKQPEDEEQQARRVCSPSQQRRGTSTFATAQDEMPCGEDACVRVGEDGDPNAHNAAYATCTQAQGWATTEMAGACVAASPRVAQGAAQRIRVRSCASLTSASSSSSVSAAPAPLSSARVRSCMPSHAAVQRRTLSWTAPAALAHRPAWNQPTLRTLAAPLSARVVVSARGHNSHRSREPDALTDKVEEGMSNSSINDDDDDSDARRNNTHSGTGVHTISECDDYSYSMSDNRNADKVQRRTERFGEMRSRCSVSAAQRRRCVPPNSASQERTDSEVRCRTRSATATTTKTTTNTATAYQSNDSSSITATSSNNLVGNPPNHRARIEVKSAAGGIGEDRKRSRVERRMSKLARPHTARAVREFQADGLTRQVSRTDTHTATTASTRRSADSSARGDGVGPRSSHVRELEQALREAEKRARVGEVQCTALQKKLEQCEEVRRCGEQEWSSRCTKLMGQVTQLTQRVCELEGRPGRLVCGGAMSMHGLSPTAQYRQHQEQKQQSSSSSSSHNNTDDAGSRAIDALAGGGGLDSGSIEAGCCSSARLIAASSPVRHAHGRGGHGNGHSMMRIPPSPPIILHLAN